MADDRNFTLKIITPDRVFYEEQVSMVEFNTVEGEVGVYKDHIPMTMIIAPGILTITKDGVTLGLGGVEAVVLAQIILDQTREAK